MKKIEPLIALPKGYVLNEQFSDDFDGDALDRGKWRPFYPEWDGRKPGRFVEKNVSVHGGLLRLASRYEKRAPAKYSAAGFGNLTAAIVRSRTRILYGCFQMRFKANRSAMSNAFWLNDSIDPPAKYRFGSFCDEIDIFEVFAKSPNGADNRFYNTAHRIATPYVECKVCYSNTPVSRGPCPPKEKFNFADDFHVATFLWDEKCLRWYLDGRLTFKHVNDYYRNAMYLNIDSEPMIKWAGEIDPEDLPAEFQVDYVRVWQKPRR